MMPVINSEIGEVRTGTDSGPEVSGKMLTFRWARRGMWLVKYWPSGGGSQGFVDIGEPFGFIVDVDDEMPHDVWLALLRACGAPTVE